MRPKLKALAATQGGVFTRAQALGVGYSAGEVRAFTKHGGPWVLIRPGAYCERELWDARDTYDGALLLRDRAADAQMELPHLMSHDSACRLHGLPMLRPAQELVHVTRFGVGGSRTSRGVKHHLTRLGLLDAPVVDGVKCTGLARTALDMAREHGQEQGVVVLDAVRRRGVAMSTVEDQLAVMWCWPNVTQARAATALCDPGAQSPGETLLRLALLELDLGPLITQFPIRAGRRLAFVDVLVGRRVFEFDGFLKFTRGRTDRDPTTVAWDEKLRQDDVGREGLEFSRVVWDDLVGARRPATLRRLAAEYHDTANRLGTEIPERHLRFFLSEEGQRLRARMLRDD